MVLAIMAKLTDHCYVYWKHTPEMTDWSQGYIGISQNVEHRNKQHERDAFLMNSPLEVHHQMRLNEGNVITDIIFEGDRQQCLDMEHELRPRWHMAWNMAAGGMFSNEWKAKAYWLSTHLYHTEYGEWNLHKELGVQAFADKFGFGKSATQLSKVLKGTMYEIRGWELQDAQLAQRVWDRCHKPIEISYLKGEKLLKVYPNGISALADFCQINKASQARFKDLIRGLRPTTFGYSLCTEEEYFANPGPVFGTEE